MGKKETHVHVNHDTGYSSTTTVEKLPGGRVRIQGVMSGMTLEFLGGDADVYAKPPEQPPKPPESDRLR